MCQRLCDSLHRFCQVHERSPTIPFGCGFPHQVHDRLQRVEKNPLTDARDVTKQTPLNGIELRTVGWIVGDTNGNAQLVDQCLQVLFEQVLAATIAAAAVV